MRAFALPFGLVLTDWMMPRREFQHTEFHADWARPNEFNERMFDNLGSHKGNDVPRAIHSLNAKLIFLPPLA